MSIRNLLVVLIFGLGVAGAQQLPLSTLVDGGSLYPPVSGATMELNLDGNSASVYSDLSGNGNNGTMGTSTNAPTNYAGQGVGFNDTGFVASSYQVITTPLLDWGTFFLSKCYPIIQNTTGTTGGNQFASFPTVFGSSLTSSGLDLLTYNFNATSGTVIYQGVMTSPTVFNAATGKSVSNSTQGFAGCHVFAYTLGTSGTSVDHFYIDGVEVTSYGLQTASRALSTIASGGYDLGVGKLTNSFLDRGLYLYAMTYSTQLSSTQVAQVSQYIKARLLQRPALQSRLFPTASNNRVRTILAVGNSLTAGLQGTTPYPSLLSTTNTYTVVALGIGGYLADEACQSFEQRVLPNISTGLTTILLGMDGTNDLSAAGRSVADVAQSEGCFVAKAHRYGARVILGTDISRTGSNTLYTTNDGAVQALNTYNRNNWKRMGFDGFADIAAVALLGASGANTNTCFYTDHIHLTNTACGININTATSIAGYNAAAAIFSNAVNSLDGSSANTPDQVTTNATTLTAANNNILITPSAAATATLPDCQGRAVPVAITNGSGANAITVSGILSQTITGSATVAANATASYLPVVTGGAASTTGGCFWLRTQ